MQAPIITKRVDGTTLYEIAVNDDIYIAHNVLATYTTAHDREDTSYLAMRTLFSLNVNRNPGELFTVPTHDREAEIIATAFAWANDIVARYRAANADEIRDYEREEGKTLRDIEILGYAIS